MSWNNPVVGRDLRLGTQKAAWRAEGNGAGSLGRGCVQGLRQRDGIHMKRSGACIGVQESLLWSVFEGLHSPDSCRQENDLPSVESSVDAEDRDDGNNGNGADEHIWHRCAGT